MVILSHLLTCELRARLARPHTQKQKEEGAAILSYRTREWDTLTWCLESTSLSSLVSSLLFIGMQTPELITMIALPCSSSQKTNWLLTDKKNKTKQNYLLRVKEYVWRENIRDKVYKANCIVCHWPFSVSRGRVDIKQHTVDKTTKKNKKQRRSQGALTQLFVLQRLTWYVK